MTKREFIEQFVIHHYTTPDHHRLKSLKKMAEIAYDYLYPLEDIEKPVEKLLDKADRLGYLD